MVVVRDPSAPSASANICPNFTAVMKTVFEKEILPVISLMNYPDSKWHITPNISRPLNTINPTPRNFRNEPSLKSAD
jgi:hypothetical protein